MEDTDTSKDHRPSNTTISTICNLKRELDWKTLFYMSMPGVIQAIRSWSTKGGGVWERETHTGIVCENLNESDLLEDLGVDGRILLKLVVKK
jgi:hypothetical protein